MAPAPQTENIKLSVQKANLSVNQLPHYLVIFFVTFTLYYWSTPETVVLEDDSFFTLAAYFNSVTHPPGYPLFTLIGHFFTWIPVGSIAFRVHLASAFMGASGCVVLWILLCMLFPHKLYAYAGAIGLGISKTFWSQAIIAEVYTLNIFLFLLLVVLALQCNLSDEKEQDGIFKWLFFIYGLSLSNHWPLILLSTPALLVLLWPVRNRLDWHITGYVPYLLLGLLPYAWMVWCSYHAPQYSFYGPFRSLHDFWFFVSRQLYAGADQSLSAGWQDKLNFIRFVSVQTTAQLAPYGIWFVIAGFIRQWFCWPVWLAVAMVIAYLGSTLILILLLGFDYDLFHRAMFQVYPLTSYLVTVIWMTLGLQLVIDQVKRVTRFSSVLYIIPLIVLIPAGLNNASANYRKHDYLAHDYARSVLGTLDRNAIFYANADNIDGPISYMNAIEKTRPDVTVFTGRYIYFENSLYRPYLMKFDELNQLVNRLIQDTKRPVYYVNDFPNDYAQDRYGFYTKVNRDRPAGNTRLFVQPEFVKFLDSGKGKNNFNNLWDYMHYNLLLSDFCELALSADSSSRSEDSVNYFADLSAATCTNYQGTLVKIRHALKDPAVQTDELTTLFKDAQKLQQYAITKKELATLPYYHAIYNLGMDNRKAARRDLQTSISDWPHPDNPAVKLLAAIPE